MHKTQQSLLRLSKERNLAFLSLREIGELIGINSPQIIKHHLKQLEAKGLIDKNRSTLSVKIQEPVWAKGLLNKSVKLLILPIIGWASAGPANTLAEESVEGYLRISSTLIGKKSKKGLFVLRVNGPSMNQAEIDGKRIENGDYIIVNSSIKDPEDGDIVVSVIDEMANVKRFNKDQKHNQIILTSESTEDFPPICIHKSDSYGINGKVIQVIKSPKQKISTKHSGK